MADLRDAGRVAKDAIRDDTPHDREIDARHPELAGPLGPRHARQARRYPESMPHSAHSSLADIQPELPDVASHLAPAADAFGLALEHARLQHDETSSANSARLCMT